MTRWSREALVGFTVKVCKVDATEAAAIGEDVLTRPTAFAALPDSTCDVHMTVFVEEVFDHEPRSAGFEVVAATTVVVRNSMLDQAHAIGPVDDGHLRTITKNAVAALSHLLAAGRRGQVEPVRENPFTGLDVEYPRAWACLTALTELQLRAGAGQRDVRDRHVEDDHELGEAQQDGHAPPPGDWVVGA